MKEKKSSLIGFGLLLICLSFSLGYILGMGSGKTELTVTTRPTEEIVRTEYIPQEPGASSADGGLVNINTARQDQLETLPGIGEGIAQRIIAYRTDIGPFVTKEQLMDVEGIGEKRFEELEHLITIGGAP